MSELDWLPQHPALGQAITQARSLSPGEQLRAAIALAGFRRDTLSTLRIDKLAQGARDDGNVPAGFQFRRLAVMASSTVEHLIPSIRVAALDRRLILDVQVAPYGQFRQVVLEDASFLETSRPDFALFILDEAAALAPVPVGATRGEVDAAIDAEIEALSILWHRTRERFGAVVLQQTVLNTRLPLFGSYETSVPGAPSALIDRFNQRLAEAAAASGVLLVDVDRQAAWSGRAAWSDPVYWHQAKQAVGPFVAPFYGDLVARVIAASCGLSRKCLVLDLDNTLWGGVVGDDGIDGLVLGQGSAAGEAYSAFQNFAVSLAARGIVLAVCSKNDEEVVEAVFARHPEMRLKRDSVAALVANWDDKPSNLRRIAEMLDLGLESFVFVDDNAAERAIVRRELPGVAVPELPDDVARYPFVIARAGYFEASTFTAEDQSRVRQYTENVRRSESFARATDMDAFLQSLEMTMEAGAPRREDIARVTQLINKTNQFNLTTRRYKEPEVERLVQDPNSVILRFRLTDRFGDNGLIAVIIAQPHGVAPGTLLIDTWLMSCRVLGRGVEAACLNVLVAAARGVEATTLLGEYKPSGRNAMVHEHYRRLGFEPGDEQPGGASLWRLDLSDFMERDTFIRIRQ
jgi:FkbH-like protein